MKDKLIAHVGLAAAAVIFIASLAVLVVQASHNNGPQIRSINPAQIEPSPAPAPVPPVQASAQ